MQDAVLSPRELEDLLSTMKATRIAFCREYQVDNNGKKAAIRAGYAEANAEVEGSRLLTDAKVKTYLAHLTALKASRLAIDADWVLRRYMAIASANPADFYDVDEVTGAVTLKSKEDWPDVSVVKGVKTHSMGDAGVITEVAFHDPMKALDAISKNLGLFRESIDVTSGGKPVATTNTTIVIGHRIKKKKAEAEEE